MQKILKRFFVLVCVLLIFILSAHATTLPNGYTQLEYIDIDSTYIDTGLYLYTNNSTNHYPNIRFTFMPLRDRTGSTLVNYLGMRSPTLQNADDIMLSSGYYKSKNCTYIDYFDRSQYVGSEGTRIQIGTKYEYSVINRAATLKNITNNTTVLSHTFGTSSVSLAVSVKSLKINALNTGADSETITYVDNKVRIYDFEVEGESHMIPAKRSSDNAVGLYDTIRNIFILPDSGIATAGPEVSYTQLEYIDIPASTCFNTNVYLNGSMDIEYEVMIAQISSLGQFGHAKSEAVVGAGFNFPYNYNHPVNGTNMLVDYFGSDYSTGRWLIKQNGSNYAPEENKKYKLTIINKLGSFSVDGTVIDTHTFVGNGIPNTVPYFIHGSYSVDALRNDFEDTMRFYHFSATGVADIVPVRRNDGVLGLYNKTTGEFLEKIGNGTLVAGPAVCAATVTILGAQFCLTENQPSGSYLTARYNNNKYYINLSVENDALNPKTITSESNNVLRIKVGNTTYNAHDSSVSQ